MEDLRVLIADDDMGMRTVIRKIVSKVEGFVLVAEASDGRAALELAEQLKPDVVFLDVEMPELNGIETARAIQDQNPNIVIIFATAYEGYMGDAFEVYAFDYLMKPFKVERVIQTLERVRERLRMRIDRPLTPQVTVPRAASGRMMLRHRDGVTFVDYEDILLVQREDRATVIYTKNEERFVTSDSLSEMEEKLPKDVFFRCHKSYIINLNQIRDITPYGRWTYVVRLEGTQHDALITHEKYEELEKMFQ